MLFLYKSEKLTFAIVRDENDDRNLDFDATEIQKKIADPQNLELLKGVMTKLG